MGGRGALQDGQWTVQRPVVVERAIESWTQMGGWAAVVDEGQGWVQVGERARAVVEGQTSTATDTGQMWVAAAIEVEGRAQVGEWAAAAADGG